jgi:hypothetical protein
MRVRAGWVWSFAVVVALAGVGASSTAAGSVLSADDAVRVAAEYLGLAPGAATAGAATAGAPTVSAATVGVERVVLQGGGTPFLQLDGRACYSVRFGGLDIRVPWGTGGMEVVLPIHELNALVDDSGLLLRAWSTEWLDPPTMKSDVRQVEANIGRLGYERWEGIPSEPPKVTLLQALYDRHVAYAEQLDVFYVTRVSKQGDGTWTSQPTWQIVMRSQTPFFPDQMAEQETPYPIYGWRRGIDAQTGEVVVDCSIYWSRLPIGSAP